VIVKKLDDVCDFISGLWTGKKPPYVKVGVIRNTNFQKNGKLDFTDIAQLDVEVKQFSTRQLRFGDIVLEKSGGGPKQPVGRVCVFEEQEGLFSLSNFTSAIRVRDVKELDYRYLHYFLQHLYIAGETEKIQTHSTGIRNLQLSLYKDFLIPLPPLSTQKKIVAKLDAIFAEIDKATAAAKANAKNAEALFQSYLTQVFNRDNDAILSTLGKYYDVRDGTHDSPKFFDEGYPLITSKNLRSGVIDFSNVQYISKEDHLNISQRSGVKKGDVLMAMIGTIGNPVIVDTDIEFAIKNVALFKTSQSQSPEYLRYYLSSDFVVKKMEKDAKGATQKFVGLGYLRSFPIKIPEYEQQLNVVKDLERYERHTQKLLNSYRNKVSECVSLKNSILKQAFTGDLVKE
jgi:type I restriction enzyme S subunit